MKKINITRRMGQRCGMHHSHKYGVKRSGVSKYYGTGRTEKEAILNTMEYFLGVHIWVEVIAED